MLTRACAQNKAPEAQVRAEPKGLADARKLPQAPPGGGGVGGPSPKAAAPPKGGPAPARGSSRVPFMDDYEREEDLLALPGSRDEVGLFKDPDFPADDASLFGDPDNPPPWHPPKSAIRWLRPDQIVKKGVPVLFSEEKEIVQGALGDAWLLGALGCVATRPDLLDVIFASTRNKLKGIYTLRFFKRGQWKNVVIDDRIPCDETGTPLYARSKDANQIWVMLVEKAYAKMHGCYEALSNGSQTYALRDLTAGAPQTLDLTQETVMDQIANGFLWQQLKLWAQQGLLGCSQADRPAAVTREAEAVRKDIVCNGGLRRRRVYSILEALEPVSGRRFLRLQENLARERAWHAQAHDAKQHDRQSWRWTGEWAAGAAEWLVNPDIRAHLDPQSRGLPAGQFWITFEDWARYFHVLHVCQLFPASWRVPLSTDGEPEPLVLQGTWRRATNMCGGAPRKGNKTWWRNPQFLLTLASGERTQVFVTVSQEDPRYQPNDGAPNGRKPFKKPTRAVDEYACAIGVAVVRKKVLQGKRKGSQLQRADVELMSRPFRRCRDAAVATPKILDPRPSRDEFVIIPMVYDPEKVV